ncbi:amino acid-binding ACT domain-containing protein, partial [human gut metagenome]
MYIDQISVFVENKKGRLAGIMEVLNKAGIDIRAMTIADTADFGILRMIVDDTDKALEALKADGCTAAVTKVIAFTIPDVSGALYNVMGKINACGINVEYMYSVMGKVAGRADIVIRVE